MFHGCTDLADAPAAFFLGPINRLSVVVVHIFHTADQDLKPIAINGLVFETVAGFEKLVALQLCALHVDALHIAVGQNFLIAL